MLTTQIAESQLLLSNDTGAVHIAVAVETPCVCISNGNHYGRFVPYPASLAANFSVVLPILENGDSLPSRFMHGSDLDIQDIESQAVTYAVLSYLSKE
jgi:ADP-heptose:LPS heptosyltransferase